MTLAQITARASSIATFTTGSPEDVRDLAACVAALAKHQMDFAGVVHDGVCMAAPKLGLAISDWREDQERQEQPMQPRASAVWRPCAVQGLAYALAVSTGSPP